VKNTGALRFDFSGLWKQDNDRCQPKRNGDVTLPIEHHGPELTVETSISRHSSSPRQAVQKYTTDGKVSAFPGADGDAFYTGVVWKDSSLVCSIEEHEDGRILPSKETWLLSEGGATLEKIRGCPAPRVPRLRVVQQRESCRHPSSHDRIAYICSTSCKRYLACFSRTPLA